MYTRTRPRRPNANPNNGYVYSLWYDASERASARGSIKLCAIHTYLWRMEKFRQSTNKTYSIRVHHQRAFKIRSLRSIFFISIIAMACFFNNFDDSIHTLLYARAFRFVSLCIYFHLFALTEWDQWKTSQSYDYVIVIVVVVVVTVTAFCYCYCYLRLSVSRRWICQIFQFMKNRRIF